MSSSFPSAPLLEGPKVLYLRAAWGVPRDALLREGSTDITVVGGFPCLSEEPIKRVLEL